MAPDKGGETPRTRTHREEFEDAISDADRLTMQVVTTALSLIGFGFTITAFFLDAVGKGLAASDAPARRLGVALLSLGLLFLAMSLGAQAKHRQRLLSRLSSRRPRPADRLAAYASPAMLTAMLLLLIGGAAWLAVILRRVSMNH